MMEIWTYVLTYNKWLASFLRRPDIAVCKAENVPVVHALGMSREISSETSSLVPDISPGKALDLVSPVTVITLAAKKALRQISGVLSSDQCITKQSKTKKLKSRRRPPPSSSESKKVVLDNSKEEERLVDYENKCVGCGEDFRKTKKKED
ncbi:hypothetical protein ILUMI_12262 [Ignelater luminosus]|uniref:Uncharacterized protein n=1 Tax=Ignelater luminosus TaxID=2038154 RepID=A0A8K0GCG9_IGNLU|nr:hypothetical protein ILUMI_12262 [Ignelater luminosus]